MFWADACIPFAVQRDGSALEGIDASTLEGLVQEGLEIWSEVPCEGGGSPEVSTASQGLVACDAVEYECNLGIEGNANIVMFRDDFQDTVYGLRFGVIALTTLTANLGTGELYDADMEINSRDEDFVVEGASGATAVRDLGGVINHELGHLLGLSHSLEQGALMREAYEGTTTPSEDDIAGMCAALGASDTDPPCSAAQLGQDAGCVGSDVSCTVSRTDPSPRGCSCRAGAAGAGGSRFVWGALAVGALAIARRRRSLRSQSVL